MNRSALFILVVLFVPIISCGSGESKSKDAIVLIETEFGDILVKLYNDTPEHKQNFLKLVDEGFYKDLLFHRVIENFMIQGGDPKSKDTPSGTRLGAGSPGYTVPAEILPKYFHKKGALAAARKGGPSNPEKRSSGSQFYIIHGDVFSPGKLDTMAMMKNSRAKNDLMKEKFTAAKAELDEYRKNQDQDSFNMRMADLRAEVDSLFEINPAFQFSAEQREAYTTVGGYPSLDGEYTVFGEVVEGLDVLDKIAAQEVDARNHPLSNVEMNVELIK
jgi:cyclophilin family peptidyl-prolyl cis-trans isomerase